jgi:SAM-dependent methyltransferase
MEPRLAREAAFHNNAYTHNVRNPVTKYYLSIQASIDFYRDFLHQHAPGKDVLEYGCGENSYAQELSEIGARAYGIDISDVAIQHCRERNIPDAHFDVMNAEELQYPDNSFDIVCGIAILHHLDLGKAAGEIARVLRPGGIAIFREPLAHNPIINLYRTLTPKLRTPDEHPFALRDLDALRQRFGKFEITYFHLFSLLASPFMRLPGGRWLLRALNAVDRGLFAGLPFLRRYAWSVAIVVTGPLKASASRPTALSSSRE